MFKVTTRNDSLESLSLVDEEGKSMAVLAPSRGGMLTRLAFSGKHVLFLDETTLRDTTKNVRGGNPVLFPSPGKLDGDAWSQAGKKGTLKQHGFARNLPWDVVRTGTEGAATVTLRLASNAATRANYPWEFTVEYTYTLRGDVLRIDQRFENTGKDPMPFGAGFHPYFHVKQSEKGVTKIGTKATRAFDNVIKKNVDVSRIDLTLAEVDLHLLDHGPRPCTLETPGRKITLTGSPEFTHWVVWTLTGKAFVCVEPWTSPGNALNTGEGLITLAPGESRTLFVEISAESAASTVPAAAP